MSLYAPGNQDLPEDKTTEGGDFLDIRLGDVLELKKKHPCGSREWLVLRVGMDFRLRCQGCGHELMIPRAKAEKSVKKIKRPEE